jgi:hypothetical protein
MNTNRSSFPRLTPVWLLTLSFLGFLVHATHADLSVPPTKLAIVASSPLSATAADLLTVELSRNPNLKLFERAEIDKVLREQGLSATGHDALQLGRLIGAEGLLIVDSGEAEKKEWVQVRLVAVRSGVLLSNERMPWPPADLGQWAPAFSKLLVPLLPKLGMPLKDAIPLSVVNLRSSVNTAQGREDEARLTLLAIHRLAQQKEIFVLERERMQDLNWEKSLSADESAFWNGAYLLEGTIDQRGYAKDVITVDALLRPPKAGQPLSVSVNGSRTNFAEVINRLTDEVTKALRIGASTDPWSPLEETSKFYAEAQWALRWSLLRQSQAAADSAWALGKHDLECATVRVKAYLLGVPENLPEIKRSEMTFPRPINGNAELWHQQVGQMIQNFEAKYKLGFAYKARWHPGTAEIAFIYCTNSPGLVHIQRAHHALELYYNFSRTLSPDEPKAGTPWYELGIEDLAAAARVLSIFHLVPSAQDPLRDELAELRALARTVSDWLSHSDSVRQGYFVGERHASHDELANTMAEGKSIFGCQVKWGCLWQERPEDCVGLYRELIGSPVFCYLHTDLWRRPLEAPRLSAWSAADRQKAPEIWSAFVRELAASTNLLLRCESMALASADAPNMVDSVAAFTNLVDLILTNAETLVQHKVDLFYLGWRTRDLLDSSHIVSPEIEGATRWYDTQLLRRFMALDDQYHGQRIPGVTPAIFATQKAFLQNRVPYQFPEFVNLFRVRDYLPEQAAELRPHLAAYRSNLVVGANGFTGPNKARVTTGIHEVERLERQVDRILNPIAPATNRKPAFAGASHPAKLVDSPQQPAESKATPPGTSEPVERVSVRKYIPLPALTSTNQQVHTLLLNSPRIWEGKLWLELRYRTVREESYPHSIKYVYENHACSALLNPKTGGWELIEYPAIEGSENYSPPQSSEALGDTLFVSGPTFLRALRFGQRSWETFSVPWQETPHLSIANGRLFAVTGESIFEIAGGGRHISVLASCRRRPAASVLDSLDKLENARIFSAPDGSLCASAGKKVYVWGENDWSESFPLPFASPPESSPGGTLFRSVNAFSGDVWTWRNGKAPVFGFHQLTSHGSKMPDDSRLKSSGISRWNPPESVFLCDAPALLTASNLYFMVEQASTVTNGANRVVGEWYTKLVCLSEGFSTPIAVDLVFDGTRGEVPQGKVPLMVREDFWKGDPSTARTWFTFGPDQVFIGLSSLPGVWSLPIGEAEQAVTKARQALLAGSLAAESDRTSRRKLGLAKYDRNKNGIIDPSERTALDEDLIQCELDIIDANHNGLLDPDELRYFDVNGNKRLDQREQAAIELTIKLLAQSLLSRFDSNSDGVLSGAELTSLPFFSSSQPVSPAIARVRTGTEPLNLEALQSLVRRQTTAKLRSQLGDVTELTRSSGTTSGANNVSELFRLMVEKYWQKDVR